MFPSDTTCEKPIASARAQSINDVASAPDCVTKATCPSRRHGRGEARVQPEAQARSARDSSGPRMRRPSKGRARRPTSRSSAAPASPRLPEPCRDHRHGAGRPPRRTSCDDVGHGRRGGADHREVGRRRRLLDAGVGLYAVNRLAARVDRIDDPLEPALQEVAQARRVRRWSGQLRRRQPRCAGREQLVEVAGAHRGRAERRRAGESVRPDVGTGASTRSASSTIRVA